ncbi:MAG: 5-deoxy-glucuronate isomerase [Peptoniphilaceae bacterium]|nr:5-deoxy-glucuronate isomerase [Peptoniphilaceae bacterium]MDY6018361.1 5-deoxy-glucuronate isomerase [Anaerococcus sp.]
MANLLSKRMNLMCDNIRFVQNVEIGNSILKYIGTKVIEMKRGAKYSASLDGCEACIVVLKGKANVYVGDKKYENIGTRSNIFDKNPTDSVYIANKDKFTITSDSNNKILIAYALTNEIKKSQLILAHDNLCEDRGKGMNKRHVNNMLGPSNNISDKLIVVEVYTDEANWSSYPPHKHDVDSDEETLLEEIYYHEMDKPQGFVFQRVYTDDLTLDETMTVCNEDLVLVPKGYHPVGVPYGYNSYYLNVMAGPTNNWKFHNQKEHEWILEREDV